MNAKRQPRIRVEDLPALATLTAEEAALILGAGRIRPGMEALEERYVPSTLSAPVLAPPTGLAAKVMTPGSELNVTWNSEAGAHGYEVKMLNAAGAVESEIMTTSPSHEFSNLNYGTLFYFEVQSENASNVLSQPSKSLLAATPTAAPSSFQHSAVPGSSTAVTISWTAVPGATGYQIQELQKNGSWAVASVSGNLADENGTITGEVTGLNANTPYSFRVAAFFEVTATPAYSNAETVTTPAAQATTATSAATATQAAQGVQTFLTSLTQLANSQDSNFAQQDQSLGQLAASLSENTTPPGVAQLVASLPKLTQQQATLLSQTLQNAAGAANSAGNTLAGADYQYAASEIASNYGLELNPATSILAPEIAQTAQSFENLFPVSAQTANQWATALLG